MRNILLMLGSILVGSAHMVGAAQYDLAHPTIPSTITFEIDTEPADRNVEFDALTTFDITSAGIRIDPLQASANHIAVDIYTYNGSSRTLVATSSTMITDAGFDFYDISIAYTFQSGTRYNVGFRSVSPDHWEENFYNMEFYGFDGGPAYTVGGRFSVLDGGRGMGPDAGLSNTVMPHVRFGDDPVVTVQPVTWSQTKALYRRSSPTAR